MLEGSALSVWIRSNVLGWPLALTIHALGTALIVGLIVVIGLRLLGMFESIPYSSLNRLFPVIWGALVVQFVTGIVLWLTKPTRYVADGAFLLKVVLLIAGIILTYQFAERMKREAASWDAKGAIASSAVNVI